MAHVGWDYLLLLHFPCARGTDVGKYMSASSPGFGLSFTLLPQTFTQVQVQKLTYHNGDCFGTQQRMFSTAMNATLPNTRPARP
jgi:hypothetical protein